MMTPASWLQCDREQLVLQISQRLRMIEGVASCQHLAYHFVFISRQQLLVLLPSALQQLQCE
jgi:hypothetical protein